MVLSGVEEKGFHKGELPQRPHISKQMGPEKFFNRIGYGAI